MRAREIYEKYKIFRGLQLHQLRAAAVARYVCERWRGSINTERTVLGGLFHDMGNIIKADLSMPELLEPEGVKYWRDVKSEFHRKYGDDEHAGTLAIMREIGLPEEIRSLVKDVGFSKINTVLDSENFELKVLQYADMRVGPFGIIPLEERIMEGRVRYKAKVSSKHPYADDLRFDGLLQKAKELEQLLVTKADFKPGDITDASMAPIIEELKDYQV
ncbi:hypothetical protein HY968_01380 [Candidatus Kaiserbacteria bacterium]|nr:hypothetical protein [Candidatus Kaiserbacteria bacterium]